MCYMGTECVHNQSTFYTSKESIKMIHFKKRNAHTAPLFFKSKIVKLPDKIKIENFLFISKYVNKNYLPSLIAGLSFPPFFITMKFHLQPKVI